MTKPKIPTCCICGNDMEPETSCNPVPLMTKGRCCRECDLRFVTPARALTTHLNQRDLQLIVTIAKMGAQIVRAMRLAQPPPPEEKKR